MTPMECVEKVRQAVADLPEIDHVYWETNPEGQGVVIETHSLLGQPCDRCYGIREQSVIDDSLREIRELCTNLLANTKRNILKQQARG